MVRSNLEISVVQVSEQMIIDSAELLRGDANNIFKRILEDGNKFKEAGLTPVYMYNQDTAYISLFALETFNKKLH
jgi:hypothetical protein